MGAGGVETGLPLHPLDLQQEQKGFPHLQVRIVGEEEQARKSLMNRFKNFVLLL